MRANAKMPAKLQPTAGWAFSCIAKIHVVGTCSASNWKMPDMYSGRIGNGKARLCGPRTVHADTFTTARAFKYLHQVDQHASPTTTKCRGPQPVQPSPRPHTRWTDGNLAGERVLWAAAAGRGRSARLGHACGFYRAGLQRTPAGAPGADGGAQRARGWSSPVRRKAEREEGAGAVAGPVRACGGASGKTKIPPTCFIRQHEHEPR